MLINFFAGLLLVYCAMSALCMGLPRHYKNVWKHEPQSYFCRTLRVAGWLLLGAGFMACVSSWGWAMGPIGWLGQVSLSGLLLVMSLPYRPRLALLLPVIGAPVWMLAWALLA
ncbi:DUF3325 domain-containing protein [Pseudomonas segetis]